ncbi:MAG: hypothetical protein L0Y72_00215 [Gemmataceae bacterium]|nr:hypothetical protein [Gemmataceae bacterium]MCI0737433.1 hypothetical protein [Gemmataceae bacterium]
MKEKLPLWFQALAIVALCCLWIGTIAWVLRIDQQVSDIHGRYRNRVEDAASTILYGLMPVPILVLGARFFWRFRANKRKTLGANLFYMLVVLCMLLASCAFVLNWFAPARQRVREASSLVARVEQP